MRPKLKQILLYTLLLTMLSGLQMSALASQPADPDALGSITVTMKNAGGESIGGGTLALYRVADITENNEYELIDPFKGCQGDDFPDNISSAEFVEKLEECAVDNSASCIQVIGIGPNGNAYFSNLKTGIYLISQVSAAEGYMNASSFVVTIPFNENGTLVYDVNATPKMTPVEIKETEPTQTKPETQTEEQTEGQSEEQSEEQTGEETEEQTQITTDGQPEETEEQTEEQTEEESEENTTTEITTTGTPSQPTSTTNTSTGTTTGNGTGDKVDTTLPQTGALLWPIILTALLGMVCIAGGIYLNKEKKAENK